MALITREGQILARRKAAVAFDGYKTPILDTVVREAEHFLKAEDAAPEGVAVSCTGQVDTENGVVVDTNGGVPGLENARFRERLGALTGRPGWVINDANAAVLGEAFAGAAKGYKDVLMVTLGTGVGGGILCGGRLLEGATGNGGEIGHMAVNPRGRRCPCGRRGCYELYASSRALVERVHRAGRGDLSDGQAIFRAVEQGDAEARALLGDWLALVADGLISLIYIFNPALVLIGGGVSAQDKWLIAPLRERVLEKTLPQFARGLRLEAAALGNDAGLYGAVSYWLQREEGKP